MHPGAYKPSQAFHDAASYLSSYRGDTSNTTKLELYSLFKYVTASPTPTTPRPALWDFTGKAKWDAWAATGNKYGSSSHSEAEKKYKEIAKELGWVEQGPVPHPQEENDPLESAFEALAAAPPSEGRRESIDVDGEEDIWDKDPAPRRAGTGQGLGVTVSSVSREQVAAAGSSASSSGEVMAESGLHAVILAGDVTKVKAFIEQDGGLDLNLKDEYGYTPLHLASDRGYLDIVRLLLEKGADKSIKDLDDYTPRDLAEVAGKADIVQLLASSS